MRTEKQQIKYHKCGKQQIYDVDPMLQLKKYIAKKIFANMLSINAIKTFNSLSTGLIAIK